ncbi:glycosyltransferase family 4 protein [Candidatus Daviesbacteria bacterium]|nr:glycosyltransferase family 4 protein [Candidatus Daviesbacteria bacterium]
MSLKIVFLSRYQNRVFRGVESHIFELSKRLKKKFQVDIFSEKDADSLTKILKGKYDFVIPANGRVQSFKAGLGRLFSSYKTLIVGHAGIGRDDIWNLIGTFPDIFVALTESQFKWAKKIAWKTKVTKIPNGIDLEKFSPTGQKADINLEAPIILSVGALEWYKNHDFTIKAVSRLMRGSLLIIGKGSQKRDLEKLGKMLLGDSRFKIIDANYGDMPSYYRACDLFTLPSWDREAFGIVYLEALATNLAVIAPDDESRKEIIGNGGILFDPSNIDAFVKALNMSLELNWDNKPRHQAEKFSWEDIALQYEKLFVQELKK